MVTKKMMRVQVYQSRSQDSEDTSQDGEYREWEIPYKDRITVLNILDYIQENYDRSLAYYKSCRIGKCTGCLVGIDGENKLACITLAKDGMKISPAKKYEVIRDLAVEFPH